MIFSLLILSVFAADADTTRNCIVQCAENQIGKPYAWGYSGPEHFDESGLVEYCYNECDYWFGFVPSPDDLMGLGTEVTSDKLIKGDIVFPYVGQCEIYTGNNQVIFARGAEGYVVQKEVEHVYTARRIITGGDETPDGADPVDPPIEPDQPDNNDNDNNNNDGETTEWVDSDSVATVICGAINVRAAATTNSEAVAEYVKGDTFYYDSIVRNSECNWVSYIANSGNRRYVCGRTPSGECYLSPCP